jgi:hypothetical protein
MASPTGTFRPPRTSMPSGMKRWDWPRTTRAPGAADRCLSNGPDLPVRIQGTADGVNCLLIRRAPCGQSRLLRIRSCQVQGDTASSTGYRGWADETVVQASHRDAACWRRVSVRSPCASPRRLRPGSCLCPRFRAALRSGSKIVAVGTATIRPEISRLGGRAYTYTSCPFRHSENMTH